jgi:serine protease SohB
LEFIFEYGLFLAKAITFILAVIITLIAIMALVSKQKNKKGDLSLIDLSAQIKETKESIEEQLLTSHQLKERHKNEKKALKLKDKQDKKAAKEGETKGELPQLYVLDFKGSIDAKEVSSLNASKKT